MFRSTFRGFDRVRVLASSFALVGAFACTLETSGAPPVTGAGGSGGTFGAGGSGVGASPTEPASGGTGAEVGTVTYAMASEVIDFSCGLSVCHGHREEPSIQADAALPSTLQTTYVEACGNLPLVTPGDPGRSAILLLVERRCIDLVMPDECKKDPCLPADDIATLRAWIEQGAPFQ